MNIAGHQVLRGAPDEGNPHTEVARAPIRSTGSGPCAKHKRDDGLPAKGCLVEAYGAALD